LRIETGREMKEMERNTEERNRLPHFRRIPEFHM
jgi:hypothetical protein